MNFLCDVHISYKIVNYLTNKGCSAAHINHLFRDSSISDIDISDYADLHDFIVITKDKDYKESFILNGKPRKLIRLNIGNASTKQAIQLFENNWQLIEQLNQRKSFFIETDETQLYHLAYKL